MKKYTTLLSLSFIGLFVSSSAMAELTMGDVPPPQPPEKNMHAPKTPEDKKRVQFAIDAMQQFFGKDSKLLNLEKADLKDFKNKDKACLNNPHCYLEDPSFVNEVNSILKDKGSVVEFKHAHIIPWSFNTFMRQQAKMTGDVSKPSKPEPMLQKGAVSRAIMNVPVPNLKKDEYMMHIYVRYEKSSKWHHLNVIVHEDKDGNLYLRHFYTVIMPEPSHQLPDGVVC